MLWYKAAFASVIKSGAKFPKWHQTMHYPDFIWEFGIPALTYTGWWEKAHRYLCKLPFLRTGRRTKRMEELLLLRIALAEIIRRKEKTLEKLDPHRAEKEAARKFDEAVASSKKRSRGKTSTTTSTAAADSEYDTQPERHTGRDKDGYIAIGER
jgi:hypothetical protein